MIYNLVLIFISLFTFISPCCPPHTLPVQRQEDSLENKFYLVHENCNFSLISPKKVINPYRQAIDNRVEPKPFGAFWLKCAACLAVANEVGKAVESAKQVIKEDIHINDGVSTNDTALFERKFSELCTNGFKNYNLRKHKEISLVTNMLHCTEHVNTQMDGSWTKKLRELCNLYTSYMDIVYIANYINSTEELSGYLCMGTGIFRDCGNMETTDISHSIEQLNFCKNKQCC